MPPRSKVTPLLAHSPSTLPAQITAVEAELNTLFYEREDAISTILVAALAGENGFIEGDPGTGKSDLLETMCQGITGGKYARFLMDKQMGKEDLFGAYDITRYLAGNGWSRDTTDTISDAHMVMLDEAGRTSTSVMGMLLTAINEKRSKPNGHWIDIPLLSAWGASNTWIYDENPAFADRFIINLSFDTLREDLSWAKLADRVCDGVQSVLVNQIVLADLQRAIAVEVPAVTVPQGVKDTMQQLRSDLQGEQISMSPRRFGKLFKLLKAAAYKAGDTVVNEDHLPVLRHAVWSHPDHRKVAERKVMALTSPITKAAMELAAQIDSIASEIDARRGKSVADRAAFGAQAQYNLEEIQSRLTKQVEAAHRKGRTTTALDGVQGQIKTLRTKIYVDCMNIDAKRAEAMQ